MKPLPLSDPERVQLARVLRFLVTSQAKSAAQEAVLMSAIRQICRELDEAERDAA